MKKIKELQLRIRGLEEEEGEDIREKVVKILAELIELKPIEIDKSLDQIFSLRASYRNKDKGPRDVLVNVLSKKLKDEIVQQSLQSPIEYNGKKVVILRELPRQIITEREKIKKLTDNLKKKGVRFRWELPAGLSFTYGTARHTIRTEDQFSVFIRL